MWATAEIEERTTLQPAFLERETAMSIRIVYMTADSVEQARKLAELAVSLRLAACANIQPSIESVYHWNGAVQTDSETAVIFKTTDEAAQALMNLLKKNHTYDCPCLISWKVDLGSPEYLQWLDTEVKGGASTS